MLRPQTIAIVKSTASILEEHGEVIIRHMYKRMFLHNPEVIPFFNPTNQRTGVQQKALAEILCAYAANIDNLEVLGSAIEHITQKHSSLQIKPEHYPIVREHLLASLREVLGDGATDEVISAWAEAYDFLADILISREKQIYHELALMPGGWEGFKTFRVIRKERESNTIISFYLVKEDGSQLPAFKPGQHITLRVPNSGGVTTMRHYSLSDKPGQEWFRISVKHEVGQMANTPEGYVSNFLYNTVDVGTQLEVAPPSGDFCLDLTEKPMRPLVLLAVDIGARNSMS